MTKNNIFYYKKNANIFKKNFKIVLNNIIILKNIDIAAQLILYELFKKTAIFLE